MDNRELLYRNQFISENEDNIQSDDSTDESSDDDSEKTLIVKKNLQTILFIINSKDRAWRGTNFVSDPNTLIILKFASSDTVGFSTNQNVFLINVRILSREFIQLIL